MPTTSLYCSGLWNVPGNIKHSPDHYKRLLPRTLRIIRGSTLRFYSNDNKILEVVSALCAESNIVLEAKELAIESLPGWQLSDALVNSCKKMALNTFVWPNYNTNEKGAIHYFRDFEVGGAEVYRKLLAIWMSKIDLTTAFASEQKSQKPSAWIDASVARFNYGRENWNFGQVEIPSGKLAHYSSKMFFLGNRLPLNASFLSADAATWRLVEKEFRRSAEKATTMPYGHDEETILADCVWRQPDLFTCVGSPIPRGSRSPKFLRRLAARLRSARRGARRQDVDLSMP